MLNSDDPTMFHTDIGREYVELCTALDYPPATVRTLVLTGVEATWLDDAEKAALRAGFTAELDRLDTELTPATP
jgi:adenosine deaminase